MGNLAVEAARERLQEQPTVSQLLGAATAELVELLDASRAVISRVIGDLIVKLSDHDRSGNERALEPFLLSDYPLTQELLEVGETRIVVRGDPTADPAEAALLERLGFDSLLMVPLRSRDRIWGLVEIYGGARGFEPPDAELAFAVVDVVGELLAELENAASPGR